VTFRKSQFLTARITAVLAVASVTATYALAGPPPSTSTTLAFSPSASVASGSAASAVITVKTSGGLPVTSGTVELFQAKSAGLPSSCAAQNGNAQTTTGATGTPNASGQVTIDLQALGLTLIPGTWGFIATFEQPGTYGKSASACLDLTVTAVPITCDSALTIAADITSGDGTPAPGSSNAWVMTLNIHACENVTKVSAQGGLNAWATTSLGAPSPGSLTLRKATGNGKNSVWIWDVGSMNAGDVATLPIIVNGSIKPNTACNTVLGLLGSWSALFTTSLNPAQQKSNYTGTSTVTVTCLP